MAEKGKRYPTQHPGYPVQPTVPMASYQAQQGHYPGAPPPYSAATVPQGAPPAYTPAQPMYQPQQYAQYQMVQQPGGYQMMMQQGYAMPMQQAPPTGQQVHVGAAFDAGARFDGIAQPRIPPPPPGCAPNTAQMAAMQGHTVVASRQKNSWFSGGSGGGVNWGF